MSAAPAAAAAASAQPPLASSARAQRRQVRQRGPALEFVARAQVRASPRARASSGGVVELHVGASREQRRFEPRPQRARAAPISVQSIVQLPSRAAAMKPARLRVVGDHVRPARASASSGCRRAASRGAAAQRGRPAAQVAQHGGDVATAARRGSAGRRRPRRPAPRRARTRGRAAACSSDQHRRRGAPQRGARVRRRTRSRARRGAPPAPVRRVASTTPRRSPQPARRPRRRPPRCTAAMRACASRVMRAISASSAIGRLALSRRRAAGSSPRRRSRGSPSSRGSRP